MLEAVSQKKSRVATIIQRLKNKYPDPKIALNFSNPLELLIATILSAQCTDERVNEVTANLFKKYRQAQDYAWADPAQFEQEIKPTGFYKNKARSIIKCCKALVEKHGGQVPSSMQELLALGGVGRKTANVVLGCAFGVPAIAVDTHVRRLAQRLGLSDQKDPDKIEAELGELVPQTEWTNFSLRLILHGRRVCTARKPQHSQCCLADLCPSAQL